MISTLAASLSALAGLALCAWIVFTTIRVREAGLGHVVQAVAAAVVALVSGLLMASMFSFLQAGYAFWKVTDNTVIAMLLSSVVSIPLALGFGWSSTFVHNGLPTLPDRAPRTGTAIFLLTWLVSNLAIPACVIERLMQYGYDPYRIGEVGLSTAVVFFVVLIFFAAFSYATKTNAVLPIAVRWAGTALAAASVLAGGSMFATQGILSLLQEYSARLNDWNILIVAYPFWILFLFGSAAILFYFGARIAARLFKTMNLQT